LFPSVGCVSLLFFSKNSWANKVQKLYLLFVAAHLRHWPHLLRRICGTGRIYCGAFAALAEFIAAHLRHWPHLLRRICGTDRIHCGALSALAAITAVHLRH
jgi:hypothetical protein